MNPKYTITHLRHFLPNTETHQWIPHREQVSTQWCLFVNGYPQIFSKLILSANAGKKYCYGGVEGEYCHCDYCKCKHGFGQEGYGGCKGHKKWDTRFWTKPPQLLSRSLLLLRRVGMTVGKYSLKTKQRNQILGIFGKLNRIFFACSWFF